MLCQFNQITDAVLDWRSISVCDPDGRINWDETYGARMFTARELVEEDGVALSLRRAHALHGRGFGVHLAARFIR